MSSILSHCFGWLFLSHFSVDAEHRELVAVARPLYPVSRVRTGYYIRTFINCMKYGKMYYHPRIYEFCTRGWLEKVIQSRCFKFFLFFSFFFFFLGDSFTLFVSLSFSSASLLGLLFSVSYFWYFYSVHPGSDTINLS